MSEDHGPVQESAESVGAVWTGLFSIWRRLLTALASAARRSALLVRRAAHAWMMQWVGFFRYHRDAALPWSPEGHRDRQRAAAIGVRALVFGVTLAALSAAGLRDSWLAAAAVSGEQLLWASARFIIIALVSPRGALDRPRLTTAFMAGLVPYAAGVTPTLRILALAGSAILTYRGLQGAGLRPGEARTAIVWSFGGQAAVAGLGWVLRALVALTAL